MTDLPPAADRPKPMLYELAAADPAVRFSPHCWKTRMALAHKGLEAKRIPWRFADTEKIAFSGQRLVPVLIDGDTVVADSWKIAQYLQASYPHRPALFGGDDAVALCRFINSWADATLLPALARIILLDIYNSLDLGDRDYFRTTREKRFGQSLEDICANREARLADFRATLTPLRLVLGNQDFISGATPAYADYCVFGMFMWARCISAVELLAPDDRISLWRERLLDQFDAMALNAATVVAA